MFIAHIIFASSFIICVILLIVGAFIESSSNFYDNQDLGFGLALGGFVFGALSIAVALPLGFGSQGALKQYRYEYTITTLKDGEDGFMLGIYTKDKTSYYVYRYEINEHTYSITKKPVSNCVIYEVNGGDNKVVINKKKYDIKEKVEIYVPVDYKCVIWEAI